MFEENLDSAYIVMQEGTSEGTQIKFKRKGYWYKKDNRGQEGLTEYLGFPFYWILQHWILPNIYDMRLE